MEAETNEPRMPIRDPDLRDGVLEHEVRPGDRLWGVLVELQKRRDDRETRSSARQVVDRDAC